jgi:hypothetical protein
MAAAAFLLDRDGIVGVRVKSVQDRHARGERKIGLIPITL